jgi:hypothetical protein
MCTVLVPPGGNPSTFNEYTISYRIISYINGIRMIYGDQYKAQFRICPATFFESDRPVMNAFRTGENKLRKTLLGIYLAHDMKYGN